MGFKSILVYYHSPLVNTGTCNVIKTVLVIQVSWRADDHRILETSAHLWHGMYMEYAPCFQYGLGVAKNLDKNLVDGHTCMGTAFNVKEEISLLDCEVL